MKEEWCRLKCLIKVQSVRPFFPIFALSASFVEKFHDIHGDVHELVLHMNGMRTFRVYVRTVM